jgi:hypothetical protein
MLDFASRPQTLNHIRGGWSHYTDNSEPVVGYGAKNMNILLYYTIMLYKNTLTGQIIWIFILINSAV